MNVARISHVISGAPSRMARSIARTAVCDQRILSVRSEL